MEGRITHVAIENGYLGFSLYYFDEGEDAAKNAKMLRSYSRIYTW